jgi:CDP-glucose 4,6-dehydratase
MEGVVMKQAFWKDKRVLITGHTGFKGSWLSLWLQNKGARVIGYALQPPTEPSLFESAKVAEGMTSITGDVRDLDALRQCLAEHEPEIVIHMAAQALVRPSYDDPIETFSTNVMGTANILESIRKSNTVKSAVMITSDKCYENKEWMWGYRETDPMGGMIRIQAVKDVPNWYLQPIFDHFFHRAKTKKPRPWFQPPERAT